MEDLLGCVYLTRARPSPASTFNSLVGMHLKTSGGGGGGGAGVGEVGRSDFCEGGGGGGAGVGEVVRSEFCGGGGGGGAGGFVRSDFWLPDALLLALLLAIGVCKVLWFQRFLAGGKCIEKEYERSQETHQWKYSF